jgi:hypothetical protein
VVERDTAAVVVAKMGNCSDRREGAGSHIPCTLMIDETGICGTLLHRMHSEKCLRSFAKGFNARLALFHRVNPFQLRMRQCANRRCSGPELILVGSVSRPCM